MKCFYKWENGVQWHERQKKTFICWIEGIGPSNAGFIPPMGFTALGAGAAMATGALPDILPDLKAMQ